MRNIKLVIEYDGKEFNGWQKQPNKLNIQGTIEQAIKSITGEEVELNASGRTDAGVHAFGQVANFKTNSNIPIDKFADYNDNLLYSYSDGRLIVENESSTIVYDENCNEVFNSNDCGYSKLSEYKNGVSKVLDESIPTYLDEKGNKLFKKIDTSIFV